MSESAKTSNNRRAIISWALFDFANSPFTTIMITAVFPLYFANVIAKGFAETGTFYWSVVLTVSNAVIILTAPVIGAIADFTKRKKAFLFTSFIACISATVLLFFAREGDLVFAMCVVILANIAFATGENLIAAFLPELADPKDIPRVSAWGWATGYLGGLVALGTSFLLLSTYDGLPEGDIEAAAQRDTAMRSLWIIVAGIFFLGGLPTFLFIKEKREGAKTFAEINPVRDGFRHVITTWRRRHELPQLFRFFAAHLAFSIGIYGVIGFAGLYGNKLFGVAESDLQICFFGVQFAAAFGALGSSYLARKLGVRRAIEVTLFIWIAGGVLGMTTESFQAYWVIAVLAGVALGASLPLGRAATGIMAPAEMEAEVFGFWGLYGRIAAMLAPLGNSVILWLFEEPLGEAGALRCGLVYFVASFIVGFILLRRVGTILPAEENA